MTDRDYYKEIFLEAAKGIECGTYTFAMLQALRDMAERDIYPDIRFGDIDCNVWSMFHGFHKKEE